jgi:hypothetical protein
MKNFAIGDKVRLFGKPGMFNSGVVIDLDNVAELVLVQLFDETTEWFSIHSITLADSSQNGGSWPSSETQKVTQSLENN